MQQSLASWQARLEIDRVRWAVFVRVLISWIVRWASRLMRMMMGMLLLPVQRWLVRQCSSS